MRSERGISVLLFSETSPLEELVKSNAAAIAFPVLACASLKAWQ